MEVDEMTRWLRMLITVLRAVFGKRLTLDEEAAMSFRVWITDSDMSVMNHASLLSVMEMGRIDLMVRTGFLRLSLKRGWYVPLGSMTVQFVRPLKMFQKAVLKTRVLHVSDRWIHLEHRIERAGKLVAFALAKSTVKKGRQRVDAAEIIDALGLDHQQQQRPEVLAFLEGQESAIRKHIEAVAGASQVPTSGDSNGEQRPSATSESRS